MLKFSFKIALAISLAWHLFLGSVFSIVIFPMGNAPIKFSKINFLGPILLEDASLQAQIKKRPVFTRVQHERTVQFVEKLDANLKKVSRHRPKEEFQFFEELKFTTKMGDFIGIDKKLPDVLFGKTSGEYEPITSEIMGPVGRREILYKPDLPPVVKWPAKMDQDLFDDVFSVKLKFYVLPDGNVELVEKVSSCGYTEIDIMAIRYMKMWQFAPIAGTKRQWGKMWLKFRQK